MRLQVESRKASATSERARRWTRTSSVSSLSKATFSRSSIGAQRKSVPTRSSGGSGRDERWRQKRRGHLGHCTAVRAPSGPPPYRNPWKSVKKKFTATREKRMAPKPARLARAVCRPCQRRSRRSSRAAA